MQEQEVQRKNAHEINVALLPNGLMRRVTASNFSVDAISCAVQDVMTMYAEGKDKADLICHLLRGVFDISPTKPNRAHCVLFWEKNRTDTRRMYLHALFHAGFQPFASVVDLLRPTTRSMLKVAESRVKSQSDQVLCYQVWKVALDTIMDEAQMETLLTRTFFTHTSFPAVKLSPQKRSRSFLSLPRKLSKQDTEHNTWSMCRLPKDGGYLYYTMETSASYGSDVRADQCVSAANALYVVQSLYERKQKRIDAELKEKIYNEIVKTLTMPLLVFDDVSSMPLGDHIDPKRLVCTFANHAFYDLTKLRVSSSPEDQRYDLGIRSHFIDFLSHDKVQLCLNELLAVRTRKESDSFKHNSRRSVSVTLLAYGDGIFPPSDYEVTVYRVNGTRIGVVITDISEKQRQLRLIEQASRAKTEFLANINHEIRTPLNSIDGNLQLLTRTRPLTDKQLDLIHRMRLSETALMALLQEVLDYAKLEQHHMKLQNETFSLRHCLQSTVEVMMAAVAAKKNHISCDFAIDVPTLVEGDSFRLQQVLVNLVSNSNNFTERGRIHIHVSLTVDRALLFAVSDTGQGISDDVVGQLFEPWAQRDPLRSFHRGTGLGLAICKELCVLMGGTIWLESTRKDAGSVFKFQVPLGAAEDTITIGETAKEEVASLKGKEVLLLYDGPERKVLVKILLGWGIRPTSCDTADEVREYVSASIHFDLIVFGGLTCAVDNALMELAHWVSARMPQVPLLGCGCTESTHDERYTSCFRKVLEAPVVSSSLFHVLVNLLGSKSFQVVGGSREDETYTGKQKDTCDDCLSILVAEDVLENQVVLVEMLQELGETNSTATNNGEEMLVALNGKNTFDLVLVDLLMPVKNGIDAVNEYRKSGHALGTLPFVVAVTATSLITNDPESYRAAGMDAFIQKPVKMQELRALIEVVKGQKEEKQKVHH